MRSLSPLRLLFALAIGLGLLLALLFLFVITDYAFSVWAHLRQGPMWFLVLYALVVLLAVGAAAWLMMRLLRGKPAPVVLTELEEVDESILELRLQKGVEQGVDVEVARRELAQLQQRRESGVVYVALLGEINVGKSSLIQALLPGAKLKTSPRGGVTQAVTHYQWTSPGGDRLLLADLPGLNEAGGAMSAEARDEAVRAHVVIYVCDGDLTRDQLGEVQALMALNKPLIIALNKRDQFTEDELALLQQRLAERLGGKASATANIDIVAVSAGGQQQVLRELPDGREEIVVRRREAKTAPLAQALQRRLDDNGDALHQLRDAAVFVLTQRKLDAQLQAHRSEQAEDIVSDYTRKAVVGAMAAVAPGADVLIQGYLGVGLVKALCALYEVPVKQLDIDRYLSLVGKQVGRTVPLLLAVSGNALKAFPGIGTLTGGLLHAVAYGLIFDSLGRAVIKTLDSRGDLRPQPTVRFFEEDIGEHLESRTRRLARLALAQLGKDRSGD